MWDTSQHSLIVPMIALVVTNCVCKGQPPTLNVCECVSIKEVKTPYISLPFVLLFSHVHTRPSFCSLNPSTPKSAAFLAEHTNAFNNNKTAACSGVPRGGTSAAGLTSAVWMISIIRASAAPSHSDTHTHTHTHTHNSWWLFRYITLKQIKWWHVLGKAVINLWLEVGQRNAT